MKVFIAEKPDIANAMASYLWSDYKSCKMEHCYRKDDIVITWAYGHILMTAMPEAYGSQFKNFSVYPIFPSTWKKQPSPAAKAQFDYIKDVVKKADVVVNGGDPDREGQLLVDEILEYVGYKGKVERILINAKDNDSLRRAFESIEPNDKYRNLYYAGLARERADWLVGMNLSRAYSVNAKKGGYMSLWRIGRVKVPTLALVVNREKEIQNFHPVNFYNLVVGFEKNAVPFTAAFKPGEDAPLDSENRILDKSYLQTILNDIKGKEYEVKNVEKKKGMESAPLPYSLDTLQIEANKSHGFSPSTVLKTVQSLYEKKFVSYPRSDCNYIPVSQHEDGERILSALAGYGMIQALGSTPSIKSRCFNDSKVSAHHAIIPTGVVPDSLSDVEEKIYKMISLRYILQFYPSCKFLTMNFELLCSGYLFVGHGKSILEKGFLAVYSSDFDEKVSILPDLKDGERLVSVFETIEEKTTTPPKRFTEGTLIAAMTNIWKFVSKDNPNVEKLKECKGIGTPATRDTIISDLLNDTAGKTKISPCLTKKGKELVPTDFGFTLINNIDESLTLPDMTAAMEYSLASIADGKISLVDYMNQTIEMVKKNILYAENHSFEFVRSKNSESSDSSTEVSNVKCPVCGQETLTRKYSPKTKKYFWICQDESCVHPVTKKKVFYEDHKSNPLIKICPQCHQVLVRKYSAKSKKSFWFCERCNEFKIMK